MNERDELAREIFMADNSASPDPAHEWEMTTRHNPAYSTYAYEIADGLIAAGYRKQEPNQ